MSRPGPALSWAVVLGAGSPAAAPRRGDSANISHLRGPVMNNINVPFAGPAEPRHPPQHSSTHRYLYTEYQ